MTDPYTDDELVTWRERAGVGPTGRWLATLDLERGKYAQVAEQYNALTAIDAANAERAQMWQRAAEQGASVIERLEPLARRCEAAEAERSALQVDLDWAKDESGVLLAECNRLRAIAVTAEAERDRLAAENRMLRETLETATEALIWASGAFGSSPGSPVEMERAWAKTGKPALDKAFAALAGTPALEESP